MRIFGSSRRRVGALVVLIVSAALVQVPAAYAAPANDAFANAQPLAVPGAVRMDTAGATFEPGEPYPDCVYDASSSVWFRVDGVPGSAVAVSTGGTAYNSGVALWSGTSLASLKMLACSDYVSGDDGRARARIPDSGALFAQVIGEYGASGDLRVATSVANPPANDNIASATVVDELPFSQEIDLDDATAELGERDAASCYLPSRAGTAWYRLEPEEGTGVRVSAPASDRLNVFAGSPGALTAVQCGYDRVGFTAAPSTTYWVQVSDYGDGGFVTVNVESFVPPANDNFDDAAVLKIGQRVQGTLDGASLESDEPGSCTPITPSAASVWYKFTLPVNQVVKIRSSVYYMAIFTETPMGMTEIACSSDVPNGSLVKSVAGWPVAAIGGKTYYVQASDYGGFYAPTFTMELLSSLGGV